MNPIKAIVFDMDGVLIDARDWHYEALNKALDHFGYAITRFEHLVTYDGLPTRRKLEMLTMERGLPKGLHTFLNELKQIYTLQAFYSKCKPTFAHEYALSRLKSDGYRLALASNSVRATVDVAMQQSRLGQYFELTVSNEDVSRAKPDPQIYTTTISRLGVTPQECLVLEDNAHGVQSAQAAGAHVMVVKNVQDVTYDSILGHVRRLQAEKK